MIQGWTIGVEVARAGVYRWAPTGEHREAFILEAVEIMTAWTALGMNASAAAHRRFEMQRARQEQNDAADVVRGVLLGGAWAGPATGPSASWSGSASTRPGRTTPSGSGPVTPSTSATSSAGWAPARRRPGAAAWSP